MSRNRALFVVALLACVGVALAVWLLGSLDKAGNLRPGVDPAAELFVLLPYGVIAVVILWNRQWNIILAACLLTVVIIAAVAIPIWWGDYQARREEPPGREIQHYGILAVLMVQWIGCIVLLALAVGYRLTTARKLLPAKKVVAPNRGVR